MIITIGIRCNVIKFIFETLILVMGIDIFMFDPWLADEYRYSE